MKERITKEQLQELSELQQEKLRDLWEPQRGDMFLHSSDRIYVFYRYKGKKLQPTDGFLAEKIATFHKEDCLPLLTISQMIEMFNNSKIALELHNINQRCDWWQVYLMLEGSDVTYYDTRGNKAFDLVLFNWELADALWTAVKEVLLSSYGKGEE